MLFLLYPHFSANAILKGPQRRTVTANWSGQIFNDTVWKDTIIVTADVVVMPGVTLTIQPGTIIKFEPAKSTKTDAYYFFPQTELVIRGRLLAEGTLENPIVFTSSLTEKTMGDWAGIILDTQENEENSSLVYCRLEYAETALYILQGEPIIRKNQLNSCNYAIICQMQAAPIIILNTIADSERGIYCLAASFPKIRDNLFKNCQEEAIYVGSGCFPVIIGDNRFQNNGYNVRWMSSP